MSWTPGAPEAPTTPTSPTGPPAYYGGQPPYGYASPPGAAQPPARPSRGPLRWIVALVVTALVVVGIVGIALFARSGSGAASVLPTYAKAGTVSYAEVRLDLPGDQRDKLAEFLRAFPGFADRASFDQKLNEALDSLVSLASNDRIDWARDVEPWFGGQVSMALMGIPDPGTPPSVLIGMTVTDRAELERVIERLRPEAEAAGARFEQETYREETIWTVTRATSPDSTPATYVVTDDAVLLGARIEDIRAALDTKADPAASLAGNERFRALTDELSDARLGAVYVDLDALRPVFERQLGEMPGFAGGDTLRSQIEAISGAIVGEIRAEGDRIVVQARFRRGEGAPALPANRSSAIAERMPPDTLAYFESRDVGRQLNQALGQMLETMGPMVPREQLDQIEDFLGTPPEEFLDFLEDVGIGVAMTGEQPRIGLVATVTDEAVARDRLRRIDTAARGLLAMGQTGVEVSEEDYAGTTVTTFDFSALTDGQDLPVRSLSYAIAGRQLLMGTDGFVKEALDRAPENSLAGDARYRAALEQAGATQNMQVVYLDLGRLRTTVEQLIPESEERVRYERDVAPYLEPFDRLLIVSVLDESDAVTRAVLYRTEE